MTLPDAERLARRAGAQEERCPKQTLHARAYIDA
jgi:hypothetical protein